MLLIGLLASCGKPAPVSKEIPEPPAETNPVLAASQLALAKSHLAAKSPEKAIPYLQASIANDSTGGAETLLTDTLSTGEFTIPTTRYTHPYPVTQFVRTGKKLLVAIGGPHPTVVHWELGQTPQATAILFPAGAEAISHLALFGEYLLVHRGETNLLCLTETLKPIANLGKFPSNLAPENLQPFSANSLLLAHPNADSRTLIWQIRDSATGETLRSESLPLYPKPRFASFQDTTLHLELEDNTGVEIPLVGDVVKYTLNGRSRIIPFPQAITATSKADTITFSHLIQPSILPSVPPALFAAITGYRLNPANQSLEKVPTPERLAILSKTFPGIPPTFSIHTCDTLVKARLADAFPEEFPETSAPARAHAHIIRETFATGDPAAITAAIRSLPPSGLPTATALLLSLKAENPSYLRETLAIAENVPAPLLNRAITVPPDYRSEQDWHGYESPDFSEIFTARRKQTTSLLAGLQLPANATEEDVQAFITHILSPETQARLPRGTLALSAITAARTLAKTQGTSSLRLTVLAGRLGASHAEILRTQATAHSTLGQFAPAHQAWIALITGQPEATHLPSDYSEAAHSAFEIADPAQADEILRTGLFRFPDDVALALRAGWIALLTDQPEQAADYLKRATRIGIPGDEVENTTALLAIAHTQLGDTDTAYAYMEHLATTNPAWTDPESIEKLTWPEHFKASLRQLTWK